MSSSQIQILKLEPGADVVATLRSLLMPGREHGAWARAHGMVQGVRLETRFAGARQKVLDTAAWAELVTLDASLTPDGELHATATVAARIDGRAVTVAGLVERAIASDVTVCVYLAHTQPSRDEQRARAFEAAGVVGGAGAGAGGAGAGGPAAAGGARRAAEPTPAPIEPLDLDFATDELTDRNRGALPRGRAARQTDLTQTDLPLSSSRQDKAGAATRAGSGAAGASTAAAGAAVDAGADDQRGAGSGTNADAGTSARAGSNTGAGSNAESGEQAADAGGFSGFGGGSWGDVAALSEALEQEATTPTGPARGRNETPPAGRSAVPSSRTRNVTPDSSPAVSGNARAERELTASDLKAGDTLDHPVLGEVRVVRVLDDDSVQARMPSGPIRKMLLRLFRIEPTGRPNRYRLVKRR